MPDSGRWQEAKAKLAALIAAGEEERNRRLGEIEGEDPEMARELRSLLAAHEQAEGKFEEVVEREREASFTTPDLPTEWPKRVGAYEIVRLLGAGGMGRVFLARRDDGTFHKDVAVKLLPPAAGEDLRTRFRTERQVLANLEHPNIARLIDGGTTDEGIPYLVMEYVEGEPLDRYCQDHDLSLEERLTLIIEVADAVAAAHRQLVVHRDLKPSNVLVGKDGHPKLLDFGIAKLLPGALSEETAILTRHGVGAMTLSWASPEQVTGGTITTATDVYGLGLLLYRLVTGEAAYRVPAEPLSAAVDAVTHSQPLRPSVAAPTESPEYRWRRRLSGDLDHIVLNALRKEPERRYATVGELAEDLRRFLSGRPVKARGDSISYRASKFIRRHAVAVAAGAALILALIAGLTATLWQARLVARERDRARTEAATAQRMNQFLTTMLTAPDPSRGKGRNVTVAQVLDQAATHLDRDLATEPLVAGPLHDTLGLTYENLGLVDQAERQLDIAVHDLDQPGDGSVELADALRDRGLILGYAGKFKPAEADLKRALGLYPDPKSADVANALAILANVYRRAGHDQEAEAMFKTAVARFQALGPGHERAFSDLLNNFALLYGNRTDFADAERMQRRALPLAALAFGKESPEYATLQANLAAVLDMQGKYKQAEPLYLKSIALEEKVLGPDHPNTIQTMTTYANMLWLDHRPKEAEPWVRKAYEHAKKALPPGHPMISYSESILGSVLIDLGRAREAVPYLRASLEAREEQLPKGHWLIASARANLGHALLEEGRFKDAERELQESYKTLLAKRGPKHERTRAAARWLAELYEKEGKKAEAARYLALANATPPQTSVASTAKSSSSRR